MATEPPLSSASTLLYPNFFWGKTTITYSFGGPGSSYSYPDQPGATGFAAMNAAQQARFTAAIAAWDRLIAPTFVQTDDLTQPGDLRVAFTNYKDIVDFWGYAYTPPFAGSAGTSRAGDIWINSNYVANSFAANSYDYMATLHEIGHAIGLRHTHESPNYDTNFDNTAYSVMSYIETNYWHRSIVGGGTRTVQVYASTPMVLDIAAIQQRYGADTATATGNDTYTFVESNPFYMSIYDAGGIDTIDLSGHQRGSNVDLTPGGYSDIAKFTIEAQIAAAGGLFASYFQQTNTYTWSRNLGIAFATTIENFIGGSGADNVTGNAASNRLDGGGGADVLFGMDGNDFIVGGSGSDTIDGGAGIDVYETKTASGAATWAQNPDGSWRVMLAGGEIDTLRGIETLRFTDLDVSLAPAAIPGPSGPWHDWNGDNRADILWRNVTTGEISAALTVGGPLTSIGAQATNWSILNVSDYDGDGKGDILFRSTAGSTQIWFSGGQGKLDQAAMVGNWVMKDSADFNGDGKADLIWHNLTTGEARLWTTNPTPGFTSTSFGNFAAEWRIESAGDFRGDGYADVLWRNVNSGDMLYFNLTATTLTAVGVGNLPTAFTVITCADITGDGKDDMLLRYTDGMLVVWHENGFSPGGAKPADWNVVFADDFNGDGKADVLWKSAAGQYELWQAGATGQFSVTVLGTQPPDVQAF